jgi:NAD(P)-dependent dehydrogenase (short-subunit alcohol dehydrogenase family)
LKGKVCLITGTGGSIGRAAALRFAEEGAQYDSMRQFVKRQTAYCPIRIPRVPDNILEKGL